MWGKIVAWALKYGPIVYRWVIAHKSTILKWISWGLSFWEIIKKILDAVF